MSRRISIHALRVEGDFAYRDDAQIVNAFLSTPSGWRATPLPYRFGRRICEFLSTPSGWRATQKQLRDVERLLFLSTPSGWRATGARAGQRRGKTYFYPRPPGGGRRSHMRAASVFRRFLSTPSGWRATPPAFGMSSASRISIHALRVEGDALQPWPPVLGDISIHALRVEGDPTPDVVQQILSAAFLSTPSGWRATPRDHKHDRVCCKISIHALRVEGDECRETYLREAGKFLSTPSGWRATGLNKNWLLETEISIHALRVEGDQLVPES